MNDDDDQVIQHHHWRQDLPILETWPQGKIHEVIVGCLDGRSGWGEVGEGG